MRDMDNIVLVSQGKLIVTVDLTSYVLALNQMRESGKIILKCTGYFIVINIISQIVK